MKNLIKVEIVAHSKRLGTDEELVTYKLTYPRIIHSQLMTYKMMSVNSASSRAIPVDKLIKVIEEQPFYPTVYQKKHSGMQGTDYFTSEEDIKTCNSLWKESMQESIIVAKKMLEFGISKQIINRTLEPYQYHCCLITGTRESFEHLFNQRCPEYPGSCKSWGELCNLDSSYTMETPLIERLKVNTGQAEIHFMDLAEKMYDALRESTPISKSDDDWHIPFFNNYSENEDVELLIKESVCKTARISYTKFGDEGTKMSEEKVNTMYKELAEKKHYSCFEHIGKAMKVMEYHTNVRGDLYKITPETARKIVGWNKNFKGFIQLRHYLENN